MEVQLVGNKVLLVGTGVGAVAIDPTCCCCSVPPCSGVYVADLSSLGPNYCYFNCGWGTVTLSPTNAGGYCWNGNTVPACASVSMGAVCITDDGNFPSLDPCVLYMGSSLTLTNRPAYPFLLWFVQVNPFNDSCGGSQSSDYYKVGGTTPVGTYTGNQFYGYGCKTITVS